MPTSAKIPGVPPPVPATTLPASPTDGQQAILVDNVTTPTYCWLLQWSAAASKWFFIGGASATSQVLTQESTANNGFIDLATVGPQVTVPRAGLYLITWTCNYYTAAAGNNCMASVKLGATATSANEGVTVAGVGNGWWMSTGRSNMARSLNASDVVKWQANGTGATANFANRNLAVLPVYVT